ncbi:MAG: glutamyl-tRNA reductase [Phycisphaerales bacterium]|nr:glutamyl-tRNA reductase [Phycisphaerales bacterium]
MNRLLYVGFTHRTAPLSVRERIMPAPECLEAYRQRVHLIAEESAVLRTCGRFETFVVSAPVGRCSTPGAAAAHASAESVLAVLSAVTGRCVAALGKHASVMAGDEAAAHLLRVAGGLDSPIPGEDHVLGQVRECFDRARAEGSAGAMLSALFRTAIRTGRRVRSETGIQRVAASFTDAAAEVLRERRARGGGGRLLVIGSGKMAAEIAERAGACGYGDIVIAARHASRATELARRVHGWVVGFEDMVSELARADAVVACTSASTPVLTARTFGAALASVCKGGSRRNILLIDLGMPRNVEADVARLPGVELHDLDGLARRQGTGAERAGEAALRHAERIVQEELKRFQRWLAARERFNMQGMQASTRLWSRTG